MPHTHSHARTRAHTKASELGEAEVLYCCDALLPRGEAVLMDADVSIPPREMRSALFTAAMLCTGEHLKLPHRVIATLRKTNF